MILATINQIASRPTLQTSPARRWEFSGRRPGLESPQLTPEVCFASLEVVDRRIDIFTKRLELDILPPSPMEAPSYQRISVEDYAIRQDFSDQSPEL